MTTPKQDPSVMLGECIARARRRKKLRQEDLARLVGIGTSTLRSIEKGTSTGTSVLTVLRLLAATDRDVADLGPILESASAQMAQHR
jgi:transcriptional regulator with XRE-family HTH domain